jgi:hypothetical protein
MLDLAKGGPPMGAKGVYDLGLMVVILFPDFDDTNSLLMNNPSGCLYLRPLGAVSSTARSAILLEKFRTAQGTGFLRKHENGFKKGKRDGTSRGGCFLRHRIYTMETDKGCPSRENLSTCMT